MSSGSLLVVRHERRWPTNNVGLTSLASDMARGNGQAEETDIVREDGPFGAGHGLTRAPQASIWGHSEGLSHAKIGGGATM